MKKFVIIVAGGSGTRMQSQIPKQFLLLNNKPILLHTLHKFIEALQDINIILVLPEHEHQRWEEIKEKNQFDYPVQIASGGSSRLESVRSGLNKITEVGIVGIHDAVRPLVSAETIQNCYLNAEVKGCAVPVVAVKDSIRQVDGNSNTAVDRSNFRIVQTPQCFDIDTLNQAFKNTERTDFTDDASVFEAAGNKIHLVSGNEENIKITTAFDLQIAELLLKSKK